MGTGLSQIVGGQLQVGPGLFKGGSLLLGSPLGGADEPPWPARRPDAICKMP